LSEKILTVIRSLAYGEEIVKFCVTPRTTSEIKAAFTAWRSGSGIILFGGASLSEHLQKLESAGAIEYVDGKWRTPKETKDLSEKYLG
jgi:hypothetical protein